MELKPPRLRVAQRLSHRVSVQSSPKFRRRFYHSALYKRSPRAVTAPLCFLRPRPANGRSRERSGTMGRQLTWLLDESGVDSEDEPALRHIAEQLEAIAEREAKEEQQKE